MLSSVARRRRPTNCHFELTETAVSLCGPMMVAFEILWLVRGVDAYGDVASLSDSNPFDAPAAEASKMTGSRLS